MAGVQGMDGETVGNERTPRPGSKISLECSDLDRDGKGIARWNGWVVVVDDFLPGEKAEVQLQQRQRSRWLARRGELTHSSDDRRRPPCILAADCGGCTLQSLTESAQNTWKVSSLQQTLLRIGGIEHSPLPLLQDVGRAFGYRNRAFIPLKREGDGRLRAGYYRPRTHRIVNLNHCPVLDPRLDRLIEPIKQDLDSTGWAADHDLIHAKGLRHLGLRLGHHSGEVLITLISSHDRYPGLLELAEDWMDRWEMVKGVCLNLQPKPNNLVLGPETLLVAGSATIAEEFCGIHLQLNSNTFFQINTPQAERIVNVLCDWLMTEIGEGTVVDAYCGIGTISLPLAAQGFDVIGLELHQGSVDQALLNAMRNNLSDQCRFRAGDVVDLLEAALVGADALVLDPPRRGLDARVVHTILDTPPQRLAYLSCDPATQARDLKMLTEPDGPYRLMKHQPVDFFPQTTHLESLALLERVSSEAQL